MTHMTHWSNRKLKSSIDEQDFRINLDRYTPCARQGRDADREIPVKIPFIRHCHWSSFSATILAGGGVLWGRRISGDSPSVDGDGDGCAARHRSAPPIAECKSARCPVRPCCGQHSALLHNDRWAWPPRVEPVVGRVGALTIKAPRHGCRCTRLPAKDHRGGRRRRQVPVGCANRQGRRAGPDGVDLPSKLPSPPLLPCCWCLLLASFLPTARQAGSARGLGGENRSN